MLRRDYGAHAIAALIDEAVAVYERRNLFRRRY
jgi:propanediol dehydratase small subunit